MSLFVLSALQEAAGQAAQAAAAAQPAMPPIRTEGVWLPIQGSTIAKDIDFGWDAAMWVSVITFFIVMIPMFYFMYRYKRKTATDRTEELDHSTRLEILWSGIPLIVVIGLFFIGLKSYVHASIAPRGAREITVQAQKWSWTFNYAEGFTTGNELVVQKGVPVKLIMSSTDVLHSFYVPEFRVKNDLIPGLYTTVWFEPTVAGETTLLCTEYCGRDHSNMLARVRVLKEAEYKAWVAKQSDTTGMDPLVLGEQLYSSRGCKGCHTLDGTSIQGGGPSFKGLFGKNETFTDGTTGVADENYLAESINNPAAKIVKGYPAGVMPTFQGQFKTHEMTALIKFIQAQK
jgi:cytochrome c oxidase subunit 2